MPQTPDAHSASPASATPLPPHAKVRPSIQAEIADMVRSVSVALSAALLIQAVIFQPFTIPSASMEPGLVTGDYLVVSKFGYGWSRSSLPFHPPLPSGRLFGRLPARGDVVVFRRPGNPNETWIKRVIGLPGDRIQITGGAVILNGRALPSTPWAPASIWTPLGDPFSASRNVSQTVAPTSPSTRVLALRAMTDRSRSCLRDSCS